MDKDQLKRTRASAIKLSQLSTEKKNQILADFADLIEKNQKNLIDANIRDCKKSKGKISQALLNRLVLSSDKFPQIVQGIRDVVGLDDPSGKIYWRKELDEDLILTKQSVPIGVLAIVFESRPDVIPQILSLALKSGNAVLLKGGSEAIETNRAFMEIIQQLNKHHPILSPDWAVLLKSRGDFNSLLNHPKYIDLVIPRGSNELVQKIMNESRIPVLGHADGVCHLYLDETANIDQAASIILDSKTQYPSACNSLETLLIDKRVSNSIIEKIGAELEKANVEIRSCEKLISVFPKAKKSNASDYGQEFGDLILAVKQVNDLDHAIAHINQYGSHHTDGIISSDQKKIQKFQNEVDSASVFSNASTRFADGFRYGFGAEVGIATSKTHARGPVGLEGLVIYKYRLEGAGQTVKSYTGENAKLFTHKVIN